VYLVYGDEPLLVIEAADAIRAAARRQGFDERKVLTAIAGFDWNGLYHAAGSLSLFGGRTLIDLRIPTGKPGARRRCRAAGILRASFTRFAVAGEHDRRRLARGKNPRG
jgi:DNA polymerase III delta subunit